MKKVGIMSMQRIVNYGSYLQAYALKQLVQQFDCEVEFVDYHVCKPIIDDQSESNNKIFRKIKKGIELIKYKACIKQKIQFFKYKESFKNKYFPILGISDNFNYNPDLDCLIIGSDEVFNCIQKNSNVGFSLELFGKDNRAKKLVSYAASFGNTTIEKLKKYKKDQVIGELLKKFDSLSVRDNNSFKIVEELTGYTPSYSLDPVLIYDYMKECEKIPNININDRYLILYAYSGRISKDESKWISKYSKQKGLKVYTIGGIQSCGDKFIDCSPFEVLVYFKNAEEVITDTFHGSIFSIINHKKFSTIIRKSNGNEYGNEEKLSDLLSLLNLKDRIVTNVEDVENINSIEINYENVDSIISAYRSQTIKYLESNLKD